jgi:hypothetical protein
MSTSTLIAIIVAVAMIALRLALRSRRAARRVFQESVREFIASTSANGVAGAADRRSTIVRGLQLDLWRRADNELELTWHDPSSLALDEQLWCGFELISEDVRVAPDPGNAHGVALAEALRSAAGPLSKFGIGAVRVGVGVVQLTMTAPTTAGLADQLVASIAPTRQFAVRALAASQRLQGAA